MLKEDSNTVIDSLGPSVLKFALNVFKFKHAIFPYPGLWYTLCRSSIFSISSGQNTAISLVPFLIALCFYEIAQTLNHFLSSCASYVVFKLCNTYLGILYLSTLQSESNFINHENQSSENLPDKNNSSDEISFQKDCLSIYDPLRNLIRMLSRSALLKPKTFFK